MRDKPDVDHLRLHGSHSTRKSGPMSIGSYKLKVELYHSVCTILMVQTASRADTSR